MAATIWVLVTDELSKTWDAEVLAAAGLTVIEPGTYDRPGVRWWKLTDDGAPAELDGHKVDLVLTRVGCGPPVITERQDLGLAQ